MRTERATAFATLVTLSLFGCSSSSSGPVATPDTGSGDVATDSGGDAPGDVTEGGGDGTACSSARETLLKPIDKVSTGEVKVLDDTAGVKTLYVDASAGGVSEAVNNPWVYVSFTTAARVDVTDRQSYTSNDWDLALKRATLHTNSGDAGTGAGGARFFPGTTFDSLTAAMATGLKSEVWFDADCVLLVDAIGGVKTTFDGWYNYDSATTTVTPKPGVFAIKGAKGDLYKLELLAYNSNPDGTTGTTTGHYKLRYAPLK
jgi:hypothetical protein